MTGARMTSPDSADVRPGRERALVACLACLVALCWACLVFRALRLATIEPAPGPLLAAPAPYRTQQLLLVLAMWGAVLWAIALPAAGSVILLFAQLRRRAQAVRHPQRDTMIFVAGYLLAWGGFGALATLAQWALHDLGALDTGMAVMNPRACGLLLIAAGVYQWTPCKHACLQQCRAPHSFLVAAWRPGAIGALRMGGAHGMNCIGCCALLMLLPFAAGVINLVALLALAALVLAETLLPGGPLFACLGGLALVAWGTRLLFP